jgi:hypothetical protein
MDWPTFVQILLGFLALVLTEPVVRVYLNRRHRMTCRMTAFGPDATGLSRRWSIEIRNRSSRPVLAASAVVAPLAEKNKVLRVSQDPVADGGRLASATIGDGGCVAIIIERLLPDRSLEYYIDLAFPGRPRAFSERISIGEEYFEQAPAQGIKGPAYLMPQRISVAHFRLIVTGYQFLGITLVIMGRIVFLIIEAANR